MNDWANARANYDRLSKWYDWLAEPSEGKCRQLGLQKLDVREGENVLEIGFGTGQALLGIAQAIGNTGKAYGIDLSAGMFKIAQARVKEAGVSEKVELICGNATVLPVAGDFFHAIFLSFTLELFDEPDMCLVLGECQRVLLGGGRICVVALSKRGKPNWMTKLYEWSHQKFPELIDCRPIPVETVLAEAGFQILDVAEVSMWGLPVEIATVVKPIG